MIKTIIPLESGKPSADPKLFREGMVVLSIVGALALIAGVLIWMIVGDFKSKEAAHIEELRQDRLALQAAEKSKAAAEREVKTRAAREEEVAEKEKQDDLRFRSREDDALAAYSQQKINLAEREALLARIRDEKDKKRQEYNAILHAPIPE